MRRQFLHSTYTSHPFISNNPSKNQKAMEPEISNPAPAAAQDHPNHNNNNDNESKLSHRALTNLIPSSIKAIMKAGSSNPYHQSHNPHGIVFLGVAENRLLHAEITEHVNSQMRVSQRKLTYGDGSVGSDGLRGAVAEFVNGRFRPVERVGCADVTVLNGVSAILDCLGWGVCDERVCLYFSGWILCSWWQGKVTSHLLRGEDSVTVRKCLVTLVKRCASMVKVAFCSSLYISFFATVSGIEKRTDSEI